VGEMMKEFGFEKWEKWNYVPYHVIYNRRVDAGSAPYVHESKIDLKRWKIKKYGLIINLLKHIKG